MSQGDVDADSKSQLAPSELDNDAVSSMSDFSVGSSRKSLGSMTTEQRRAERKLAREMRKQSFAAKRAKKGKAVKTVSFAKNDDELVRVHPIATYKRWNYR